MLKLNVSNIKFAICANCGTQRHTRGNCQSGSSRCRACGKPFHGDHPCNPKSVCLLCSKPSNGRIFNSAAHCPQRAELNRDRRAHNRTTSKAYDKTVVGPAVEPPCTDPTAEKRPAPQPADNKTIDRLDTVEDQVVSISQQLDTNQRTLSGLSSDQNESSESKPADNPTYTNVQFRLDAIHEQLRSFTNQLSLFASQL